MSDSIKEIQIQSVIYNNNKASLVRAMKALHQAVQVFNKRADKLHAKLVYGDASPNGVLQNADIQNIQEMFGEDIEFVYREFGYNTGTARGHNLLLENCNTEYVLIMNPDVILEPSCLIRLMEPFKNKKVAMTEARQTPLEHAKEYDVKNGETEWASTACAVFRRDAYEEIGGFDADTFFMYCDDLDFSWRIRMAGYQIIYVPSAIVYHAKNLTVKADWKPTKAEIYYSAEASILLAYKWSDFERVEYLQMEFAESENEDERRAAAEFVKRKEEGRLPESMDKEHKIARFVENEYCKMRFIIGEDEEING